MLLYLGEKLLHRTVNLGGVARTARHRRDRLARGFLDNTVEDGFVVGHRSSGEEPTTSFQYTVHLTQGEWDILRVVNGEASRDQVERVGWQVEGLIEIKLLEIDSVIDFFVFFPRLGEQQFGNVRTGNIRIAFQSVVVGEALLAGAAAHILRS